MNRVMMFTQAVNITNDIKPLTLAKQIRTVCLDLDSPRMKQAMERLGLVNDDLNNMKRMDDFAFDYDKNGDRLPADNKIVEMRFKHYQRKMMERINRVVAERKVVMKNESTKQQISAKFIKKANFNQSQTDFNASLQTFSPTHRTRHHSLARNEATHLNFKHKLQLHKVDENFRKSVKVLQASLNQVERNTVTEVLREAKNRKIALKRSELKELTSYEIKRENEERHERIK